MTDAALSRKNPVQSMRPTDPIEFIDLKAQQARIEKPIQEAVARVLKNQNFILGTEVKELEQQLSQFCRAKHSITCANGTDALVIALKALGIKADDAVLVPSFTFAATAEAVSWVGGTPVFVDVLPDTFNMDPASLEVGIHTAKKLGLNPVGLITVDLFGQPADMDKLFPIAEMHNLWTIVDAAQSFGASYNGKRVGQFGTLTTTSFFPAKPLGCYGDGGAIFTNNPELSALLESLRFHGKGQDKYDNVRVGTNSRLDTLQAAILQIKLSIFADEIAKRQIVAARYNEHLAGHVITPTVIEGAESVWAQYTLRLNATNRASFMAKMKDAGIPTAMYYPKPLHKQTAYLGLPTAGEGALTVSEMLAEQVISLPMHPYLTTDVQDYIIENAIAALGN